MPQTTAADSLIRDLDLQPHPEGGFYRLTYTAPLQIPANGLPAAYGAPRPVTTAILFLLSRQSHIGSDAAGFSAFHRIRSDEMWHFYSGAPLAVHVIAPDGTYSELRLGPDPRAGEQFQAVVPAGCWFSSAPVYPDTFALVGCTVAPGFDFADFELAGREALVAQYPQQAGLITQFTRA